MTDAAPPPTGPDIVSARPAPSRRALYLGLAATAAVGVILAAVLAGGGELKTPDSDQRLAIAVQPAPRPKPIPIRKSGEPLNAIPDEAASLPANPPRPVQTQPTPVLDAPAPAEDRPARAEPAFTRPSFDCGAAQSRAERIICSDERLAAADRRMDRLYLQALDAGVPQRILRRQQRAFLAARDDAARDGPDAIADVYSERIAELEGMARGY